MAFSDAIKQGCLSRDPRPAMLSRVARVEIKVVEKLYRGTQRAFLFNLLVFFGASKCICLCI